ncbi:acyl carrier protein [Actinokineospora globicatena]|uniref:Phosphopantetheine attachment site n=1 Tax=Actinokineospora globicatena TaxID=103729 RepID=A0A9W6V8P9_9PSEU|nr:acyl carrier protein [Actinokineospora globicatena]MCP2302897.1 hypothetical protein [Actinokineospora globicatena]GLW78719.1 hypothetical protein Aglo01_32010 [Actinokineospora globicatena]GLW84613.1 hypothetical protein Aglo02_22530 [Actinokineospora globicatena]GLW91189.1 hypothetical protein Aglo03_20050 [Actinokineospora globicatena]
MSETHAIKVYITTSFAPDVSPDELGDDYDLLANGVVESLHLLRLIAWLGERFEVNLEDADVAPEDFRTVATIHRTIAELRGVATAAR